MLPEPMCDHTCLKFDNFGYYDVKNDILLFCGSVARRELTKKNVTYLRFVALMVPGSWFRKSGG